MFVKLFEIIKWEIKRKIKNKSFWIISIFISFMVNLGNFSSINSDLEFDNSPILIGIFPSDLQIQNEFIQTLNQTYFNIPPKYILVKMTERQASKEKVRNTFACTIKFTQDEIKVDFSELLNTAEQLKIINDLNSINANILNIQSHLENSHKIVFTKNVESQSYINNNGTGLILAFIFIALLIYSGNTLARSFYDDKLNGFINILLTSTNYYSILFGKFLGIFSITIIQLIVILIPGFIFPSVSFLHSVFSGSFVLVLHFITSYILIQIIYIGFGSIIKTEQNLMQLITVLSLILFIPFMILLNPSIASNEIIQYTLLAFPITSFQASVIFKYAFINNYIPILNYIWILIIYVLVLTFKAWFNKRVLN